jgi:hypothetical protein
MQMNNIFVRMRIKNYSTNFVYRYPSVCDGVASLEELSQKKSVKLTLLYNVSQ